MDVIGLLSLAHKNGAMDSVRFVKDLSDELVDLQSAEQNIVYSDFQQKLKTLLNLVEVVIDSGVVEEHELQIIQRIIESLCMPMLMRLSPLYDSREDSLVIVSQIAVLLVVCLGVTPQSQILTVLQHCLKSVKYHVEESGHITHHDNHSHSDVLDIHCSLEILHCFVNTNLQASARETDERNMKLESVLEELFQGCLNVIAVFRNKSLIALAFLCVSKLLKKSLGRLQSRLTLTWKTVSEIWDIDKCSEKPLMLLCGLANYFFPVDGDSPGLDLRLNTKFWCLLQSSISQKNPLTRKRAGYLLKRITDICQTVGCDIGNQPSKEQNPRESSMLFWWRKSQQSKLTKIFEDYILLIETLEEKQVHVIKPLLSRLQSLVQATVFGEGGNSFLHTSWLVSIVRRGLMHESMFIVRWITELVLNLDLTRCPFLQQGQDKYLNSEFLLSVQEPKLYIREPGIPLGTCPGSAPSISTFFNNCWSALPDTQSRASFFQQVLQTIITNTWGPMPLLFIYHGLAQIPVSPLFNKDGIDRLRKTLSSNITTWNPYMRGAVHHFCGQIFMNLTDTELVSPADFASLLSVFHSDESLQRGSSLWREMTQWLQKMARSGNVIWSSHSICQYLHKLMSNMLQVESGSRFEASEGEVLQVVRMVLLCVDGGIVAIKPSPDSMSLGQYTAMLTDTVNSTPDRPYLSPAKAEKALEMMLALIKEINTNTEDEAVAQLHTLIDSCSTSLPVFVQQQLQNGWNQPEDLGSIEVLCQAIGYVCERPSYSNGLEKLAVTCANTLKDHSKGNQVTMVTQMKRLGASCLLSHMCTTATPSKVVDRIISYVPLIDMTMSFIRPATDISQKEWGKLTSLYIRSQMTILEHYLQSGGKVDHLATITLETVSSILNISQGDTVLPVMKCIGHILPEASCDDDIVSCLTLCWSSLQETVKATHFWEVLQVFVHTVFQSRLLRYPTESKITKWHLQCAQDLFEFGAEKSGVVNVLMRKLYSVWHQEENLHFAENYLHLVVSACMFGAIHKKQDRQILDVHSYLWTLGDSLSINQLKPWSPSDMMVRVDTVSCLCSLNPKNQEHLRYISALLTALREKYQELLTIPSGQTFSNSQTHRQKNRLVQFMVLLLPFITQADSTELWDFTWDMLMQEMQPSVRHYLEWIIMVLTVRYPNLVDKLWSLFDEMTEKRTMSLCSMFCVLGHVGPHLDEELWIAYYSTALYKVIPWCMAHHFNTRVHAQATLVKLWQQCERLTLTQVLHSHDVIRPCFTFFEETNNSTKNVKRLLENYFFQVFDPVRDFSIETIFHTLPRLGLLNDDEWIPEYQFTKALRSCAFITVANQSKDLQEASPGPWRFKGIDETEEEAGSGDGNVQKKIMPWRHIKPEDEALEQLEYNRYTKHKLQDGGLILVTSLLEKIPNIGGLCRTSEIFGVSEFVVRKLSYVDDKMFQSLSVTAHKWIPITEVYHERLQQYLEERKQEGYTLVGVEQTANSVSLTDFQFPTKSLLLLGNEKEGIPVELINMLDVCVEIPQQGVIRSLNVHVSGALMVWEYRRQQLVILPHK